MKLFKTPKAIAAEIEHMIRDERNRREDRAVVSGFFNGEPPMTDAEAEELGFQSNVNHLLGYADIAAAKEQVFGLFTKPTQIFTVELDYCPNNLRQKAELEAAVGMNELVKAGRLKPAYEGLCGDAALHGEGVLFHPNSTDWCPRHAPLSRLLIPSDATTDVANLTHWGIEHEFRLGDLIKFSKTELPGWKLSNVRRVLSGIYKDHEKQGQTIDWNNPEQMEYDRQANPGDGTKRSMNVRVIYFYEVRHDKSGSPVDVTIMMHSGEMTEEKHGKTEDSDRVLFSEECHFDAVRQIIHPYFMDCTLGGEPKWHRVIGLGHLNFQLNKGIEILLNRTYDGTMDGMRNMWTVKDAGSREDIERILMKHNGVIPEGVELMKQRFQPDLSGSLGMINFFRQQGSRNARQLSPNSGDQGDMLEVQAVAIQNQFGQQSAARTSNWYDCSDRLGSAIWERLVNPFIRANQPGYSEILKFQARMKRVGVPLYWLQPHNVRVTAARVLGDGDSQNERAAAVWLTQNRTMFPPAAQQRITRMATAAFTGSYSLAEQLVPIDEQPDASQVQRANDESNTCIVQGRPPKGGDEDIDDIHVATHFEAMVGIVERAMQYGGGAFNPMEYLGFQALGAHIVGAHIQKIEGMVGPGHNDQNREKSKQWMTQLNEIASMGEKLANNMKQQQEGGDKPDPVELAKLQLEAQKLQLAQQKFQWGVEKHDRQQSLRENESAFRHIQQMGASQRAEMDSRNKRATNDVKTAAALMKSQQGVPT